MAVKMRRATGIRVWLFPEKREAELGERRFKVEWYEPREGADPDDEDGDPMEQFQCHARAFKMRETALAFAKDAAAKSHFGEAEVQEQVVDWYVEEDGVAEWADVGSVETVYA